MEQKTNEFPFLMAQKGPLQGQVWAIKDEITIGRDPNCDIVIDDRQVSRKHAQIFINPDKKNYIADLNSKNGTLLNGEFVADRTSLKDGDEIIVGLVQEFTYVSSDATLPLGQAAAADTGSGLKLFIDKKARRIWIGEKELIPPLSVSQYELLVYLYEHQGSVVTREEIVDAVWKNEKAIGVTEQALDALVRRLRDRLNKNDPTHDYILTVRGVGFKLENDSYS
jgi:pSer/pThr/pTyr-binding forkhead associated (FHA) protein